MKKKGFLFLLFLVLSVGIAFSYAPKKSNSYKDCPKMVQKIIDLNSVFPAPDGLGAPYRPLDTDDPIGDVIQFGTTWYDIQHNGVCGRQLQVDNVGWIHLVWMNGLNTGATNRHVYYQLMDNMDQLMFTQPELGIQVDQSPRAGYTVMELYPDNRAMPAYHQLPPVGTDPHAALAFDYFPGFGAFSSIELPWVYIGTEDLSLIWPRMDIDLNNKMHILTTESPASGIAGDPQRLYYFRAGFDNVGYEIFFDTPEQIEIGWTEVIASDIAASPVSNRVAFGRMEFNATLPETTQYDNELILYFSDDGINWNFTDTVNVTNWIPPDYGLLPDTLAADKDTLRCYTDMCLLFDYDNILHVFFSTRGFYSVEGTITWGNGFIWHWDEYYQVYSVVATAWFDNGFYDPGAWNIYANRPSAAVDPETNELYCMYQRYMYPVGPSTQYPYPYMVGDTTDFSQARFPNGEVYVCKSNTWGYSWTEGVNVTNTHTPNAPLGECMSELTPCMAPAVYNDQLHIFYIEDKDAGAVVQTEGGWTLNDAVYHRVPINMIPDTPLLQPLPMHCDRTGMPDGTEPPYPHDVAYANGVLPDNFKLEQNYPNPFNPETSIKYSLFTDGYASLKVFNTKGEKVATIFEGKRNAGSYEVVFDASQLASGVYFYTLRTTGFAITKKMVVMK